MPSKINRVKKDDVDRFRHFVELWQPVLGLNGWRIIVSHKPKSEMMADTIIDLEHFLAHIEVGKSFDPLPMNDETLEGTAVHELTHILLAPLKAAASSKTMSDEEKYAVEEAVVNVLEKLIYEGIRPNGRGTTSGVLDAKGNDPGIRPSVGILRGEAACEGESAELGAVSRSLCAP